MRHARLFETREIPYAVTLNGEAFDLNLQLSGDVRRLDQSPNRDNWWSLSVIFEAWEKVP